MILIPYKEESRAMTSYEAKDELGGMGAIGREALEVTNLPKVCIIFSFL